MGSWKGGIHSGVSSCPQLRKKNDSQESYKYLTGIFQMSPVSDPSAVVDDRTCFGLKLDDLEALGPEPSWGQKDTQ